MKALKFFSALSVLVVLVSTFRVPDVYEGAASFDEGPLTYRQSRHEQSNVRRSAQQDGEALSPFSLGPDEGDFCGSSEAAPCELGEPNGEEPSSFVAGDAVGEYLDQQNTEVIRQPNWLQDQLTPDLLIAEEHSNLMHEAMILVESSGAEVVPSDPAWLVSEAEKERRLDDLPRSVAPPPIQYSLGVGEVATALPDPEYLIRYLEKKDFID